MEGLRTKKESDISDILRVDEENLDNLNSREKLAIRFLNGEASKKEVLDYIAKIAGTYKEKQYV